MNWINFYGLAVMLALMAPNILYAVRVPEGAIIFGKTGRWKRRSRSGVLAVSASWC